MSIVDVDRLAFPDLASSPGPRAPARPSRAVDLPIGRLGREPIALAVDAVPLRIADDRVGAVGLLLADVTERAASRRSGATSSPTSRHELKTPVGALTLLAEAVQEAADDPRGGAPGSPTACSTRRPGWPAGQELIELSRLQGADPLPGPTVVDVARSSPRRVDRTRLRRRAGLDHRCSRRCAR